MDVFNVENETHAVRIARAEIDKQLTDIQGSLASIPTRSVTADGERSGVAFGLRTLSTEDGLRIV